MDIKNDESLYIHFGTNRISNIVRSDNRSIKPEGLWASRLYIEDDDYFSWFDWSVGEEFRLNSLIYFSIFELVNDPKILYITDLSNVDDIYCTNKHSIQVIREDIYDRYDAVELYHGDNYSLIHLGMDFKTKNHTYTPTPYYSWDVDSICIFKNQYIRQLSAKDLEYILHDSSHKYHEQLVKFVHEYQLAIKEMPDIFNIESIPYSSVYYTTYR